MKERAQLVANRPRLGARLLGRSGRFAAAVIAFGLTALTPVHPAYGEDDPHCTVGDAHALVQAVPVLPDSRRSCYYRVFLDGETYTFCEHDVIVGGLVWYFDYKAFGISRDEAIAEIERVDDRVWLSRVEGEPVEQVLLYTAFKDWIREGFEQIVYQHRAFITRLEPGEYLSLYLSNHPEFGSLEATVHIRILPHELAH